MAAKLARTLDTLFDTIQERRNYGDPATSYVAKITAKGRKKICQKIGEEAVETVIAGVGSKPEKIVSESADLLFHLMVLWADAGITLDQLAEELNKREGTSGIDEKARRTAE